MAVRLHRFSATLDSWTSAVTSTRTATPKVLRTGVDGVEDQDQQYSVSVTLGTVTGTSPTFDVTVEHSPDNVNFTVHTTCTQLTAAGTLVLILTDKPLLPYVRAKTTIAGTSPSAGSGTIKLHSDAQITLAAS